MKPWQQEIKDASEDTMFLETVSDVYFYIRPVGKLL